MHTTAENVRKALKGVDSSVIPDASEDGFSIELAISKASRLVDVVLSGYFTVPEDTPPIIGEIATDLAVAFCLDWIYMEENSGYCQAAHNKYKRSLDLLKDIRDGKMDAGLVKKVAFNSGLWVS